MRVILLYFTDILTYKDIHYRISYLQGYTLHIDLTTLRVILHIKEYTTLYLTYQGYNYI